MTYNPVSDEMFWAEKGRGAFMNDKRLRVAARRDLGEAVLATGIPFMGRGRPRRVPEGAAPDRQRVAGVRRFGSAALDMAYVAAGRFDGFWERGPASLGPRRRRAPGRARRAAWSPTPTAATIR